MKMVYIFRKKAGIVLTIAVFFIPFAFFHTIGWFQELQQASESFQQQSQSLTGEINALKDRFSHAEYLLHIRQKKLHFYNATRKERRPCRWKTTTVDVGDNSTQPEPVLCPEDMFANDDAVVVPTLFGHLPHLLTKPNALVPRVLIGKGRQQVSLVIGVPTVRRSTHNYVDETLESLLRNLNEAEQSDVVVVLMVADITNLPSVDVFIKELSDTFAQYIDKGILEIIAPPPEYYPDLDKITPTLGDPPERMKWRTKQTLDFAYLMMYAHPKGVYYMQLEDDVVTKPGYATKIKTFVASQNDFIVAEFSSLGFIGKLFKSSDLPTFIEFIIMFHETKPVDWLLSNYLFVKVCLEAHEAKYCPKALEKAVRKFKPALFQHMGLESSLKGKVQKLREKDFGAVELFIPHPDNPVCKQVSTTLKIYQGHTIEDAYAGKNFFWALNPQPGDSVTFEFAQPTSVKSFIFKSGNAEHPTDQFYDAVIEAAYEGGVGNETYSWTQVGNFRRGIAEGSLPDGKPALAMRIRSTVESAFWVTLREIWIKTDGAK